MALRDYSFIALGSGLGVAIGIAMVYGIYFPQLENLKAENSELSGQIENLKSIQTKVQDPETPQINTYGRIKVVDMTASQFSFSPNRIRVNLGDVVVLRVLSKMGKEPRFSVHSILIQGYGVEEDLPKDKVTTIIFPADKPGTFFFRCSIDCGSKHADMLGEFIVEE